MRIVHISFLLAILLASCHDRTPTMEFSGGQLYLGEGVDTLDGMLLREYLEEERLFGGGSRVLRLSQTDSGYLISIVAPGRSLPQETAVRRAGHFGRELSTAVFAGAPVDVELVDQGFRPYAVAPFREIAAPRSPAQLFARMSGEWRSREDISVEIDLLSDPKRLIVDSLATTLVIRQVDTLEGVISATAQLQDFYLKAPKGPGSDTLLLLIAPGNDTLQLHRAGLEWLRNPTD